MMKKISLILIAIIFIMAGCSSNNTSQDKKSNSKSSQQNTESKILIKTKNFLEYSYTKNDIKQMKGYENILSEDLIERVENQNQTYDNNKIKKSVEDISLYKKSNTKKLEIVYIIKVKSVNDTQKNIDYNEHFGTIDYKNENGTFKISNMKEISNQPYE